MLHSDLLALLCCPETHQPLRAANTDELALANREGAVNRAGRPIGRLTTEGLVREDGEVLYPIWDEIPCLLIEEGILLRSSSTGS